VGFESVRHGVSGYVFLIGLQDFQPSELDAEIQKAGLDRRVALVVSEAQVVLLPDLADEFVDTAAELAGGALQLNKRIVPLGGRRGEVTLVEVKRRGVDARPRFEECDAAFVVEQPRQEVAKVLVILKGVVRQRRSAFEMEPRVGPVGLGKERLPDGRELLLVLDVSDELVRGDDFDGEEASGERGSIRLQRRPAAEAFEVPEEFAGRSFESKDASGVAAAHVGDAVRRAGMGGVALGLFCEGLGMNSRQRIAGEGLDVHLYQRREAVGDAFRRETHFDFAPTDGGGRAEHWQGKGGLVEGLGAGDLGFVVVGVELHLTGKVATDEVGQAEE